MTSSKKNKVNTHNCNIISTIIKDIIIEKINTIKIMVITNLKFNKFKINLFENININDFKLIINLDKNKITINIVIKEMMVKINQIKIK